MNAVTVGIGALAGSVLGAMPLVGTFWDGLWAGGASFVGSPGLILGIPAMLISGLPSAIPATSAGLATGTLLGGLQVPLEAAGVFGLNGLGGTLLSGLASQIFNIVGNLGAGLV